MQGEKTRACKPEGGLHLCRRVPSTPPINMPTLSGRFYWRNGNKPTVWLASGQCAAIVATSGSRAHTACWVLVLNVCLGQQTPSQCLRPYAML